MYSRQVSWEFPGQCVARSDRVAVMSAKNPLRDRKAPFAHFTPVALTISLGKTLLIRGVIRMEHHQALPLPSGGANIAKLVASELAPGFIKDVLVSSTARGIEHVVVANLSIKTAGRLMRGTLVAADAVV
jgi:hypothetical protein